MLSISLNLLIPATVITSCVLFVIFNFFASLRKRFPIKVNCWFCNTNARVPYANKNSFVCASCQQFNGFDEDGDYNQEIPEQHHSRLNTSNTLYCQKTQLRLPATNGLCEACNRNQEMKVIQLANFKPRCEADYDEEIEEYRRKLEDSYQLCQQCQRHLNKTLNRVKTKLIGSKVSQIIAKGFQAVKTQKSTISDSEILAKFAMTIIFILSVANLVTETEINVDFIRRALDNESLLNVYYHLVAFRLTVIDLFGLGWMKELNLDNFKTDSVAVVAVILNISIILSQKQVRFHIVASLLMWSMKMALSEVVLPASYALALKGSVSGILVIVSLHMLVRSGRAVKPTLDQSGTSFRKLQTEIADESDEDCDLSESISSFSTKYSPTMSRTLIRPAATLPLVNKSIHNSTLRPSAASFIAKADIDARSVSNFDSVSKFDSASKYDSVSNRSFSIRHEVSAADRNQVQKDINKLNISGNLLGSTSTLKDFSLNRSLNPFSLENSRCGSPTPSIASVFSGSFRAQAISPPRFEPTYVGEASWVAGGYWSSPQKRLDVASFNKTAEMSRSSSQSSGLGTIDSDKNSRENSIGRDEFSIFSEPVRRRNLFEKPSDVRSLFEKRSDTRSLFGQSFAQPPRSNNLFNTTNHLNAANSFRQYRESNATFFK